MADRDVTRPFTREVDLGHGISAVWFAAGGIGIRHRCKVINEAGDRLINAPQLHPDHTVHNENPLTITASVSCGDCGLHGWVTEGHWVPA